MFLPVPSQLFPISHHSMNASISSPNSVQFSPSSNLNIRNGSDSYYYNNSGSWANKTPHDLWNPFFAISPFLNIPKNLIVPPTCLLNVCPTIIGTQRGDIIIATAVNNARILGLGGNDVIECGIGNCNVFTAFGNNVLMSGPSTSAHLYGGSGGYFRPGNNIFIGGGGETLMVGGRGNDQFMLDQITYLMGDDVMIGGSGVNYFDCGPNGNGVILDFNPAKGDTKAPNCKFVITSYSNNIFGGPGLPNIFGGPGLFPGQNLTDFNANQAHNTNTSTSAVTGGPGLLQGQNLRDFNANQAHNTNTSTSAVTAHTRIPSSP